MPPVPVAVDDLIRPGKQAAAPSPRAPAPSPPGLRLLRLVGLLRQRPKIGAIYQDPLFRRPDLVEDDYYRLGRQPGRR